MLKGLNVGIDKSHINRQKVVKGKIEMELKMTKELQHFVRYCELLEKIYGTETQSTAEDQQELDRLAYKLELHGVPEIHSEMNFNRLDRELEKRLVQ